MGELIIKIPEDIHETFDLRKEPIDKELEKLEATIKKIKQKMAIKKLLELAGVLPKDFKVIEEELHLQGD